MGESTLPKLGELHVAYYNKGDNEFSILEGGNYAFKTVSPDLVHSDQRNTCDGVQQRYVAKEYFLDATQGTDVNSI